MQIALTVITFSSREDIMLYYTRLTPFVDQSGPNLDNNGFSDREDILQARRRHTEGILNYHSNNIKPAVGVKPASSLDLNDQMSALLDARYELLDLFLCRRPTCSEYKIRFHGSG